MTQPSLANQSLEPLALAFVIAVDVLTRFIHHAVSSRVTQGLDFPGFFVVMTITPFAP